MAHIQKYSNSDLLFLEQVFCTAFSVAVMSLFHSKLNDLILTLQQYKAWLCNVWLIWMGTKNTDKLNAHVNSVSSHKPIWDGLVYNIRVKSTNNFEVQIKTQVKIWFDFKSTKIQYRVWIKSSERSYLYFLDVKSSKKNKIYLGPSSSARNVHYNQHSTIIQKKNQKSQSRFDNSWEQKLGDLKRHSQHQATIRNKNRREDPDKH